MLLELVDVFGYFFLEEGVFGVAAGQIFEQCHIKNHHPQTIHQTGFLIDLFLGNGICEIEPAK